MAGHTTPHRQAGLHEASRRPPAAERVALASMLPAVPPHAASTYAASDSASSAPTDACMAVFPPPAPTIRALPLHPRGLPPPAPRLPLDPAAADADPGMPRVADSTTATFAPAAHTRRRRHPCAFSHCRPAQLAPAFAVAIAVPTATHHPARSSQSGVDLAVAATAAAVGGSPGRLRARSARGPSVAVLAAAWFCRRPLGQRRGRGGRKGRGGGRVIASRAAPGEGDARVFE
uniref:Uncharacterized protein n=1 Tax=Oryza nivara TaxID=4536 RepID=A0A0E0IG56_ORYNI